jgi:hypothetical protein
MLGISGFESSANFVEEQQTSFSKTLRNMYAIVSFFNPAIALLFVSFLLAQVENTKNHYLPI